MDAVKPTKLDALTSLRFFAALLVVLLHCGQSLLPVLPVPIANLIGHGGEGVTLFFVLSGFILSFTYVGQAEAKGRLNLRSFFVNRFARIYPVYFVCLLLRLPWTIYMIHKAGTYSVGYLVAYFGSHLTVLQSWYPPLVNDPAWLNQSWTLTVEFFFYSVFPFLLLPLMKLKSRQSIAIGLALIVVTAFVRQYMVGRLGDDMFWSWQFPPTRLGEFVLGMGAGIAFTKGRIQAKTVPICLWGGLVGLLAILMIPNAPGDLAPIIVTPISAASLIVGLCSVRKGLLCAPAMVLLGEASYSLYLSHGITKDAVMRIGSRLHLPALEASIPVFLAYLVASILVSIAFFKWIEVPARKFLRAKLSPTSGSGSLPIRVPRQSPRS